MMELLSQPVGVTHHLIVGAVLFVCGVICMACKRYLQLRLRKRLGVMVQSQLNW